MSEVLRVITANLLNNSADIAARYQLFSECVAETNASLLCLQEVSHPNLIEGIFTDLGFTSFISSASRLTREGCDDYRMIVSKTELVDGSRMASHIDNLHPAIAFAPDYDATFISAHFPWGGPNEARRLQYASWLDGIAAEKSGLVFLGADTNCELGSRTMNYLLGKDLDLNNEGTYWTNVDDNAWRLMTEDSYATVSPKTNHLAARTYQDHGGAPNVNALPSRKIDFLLSRGWNYGKRGGATHSFLLSPAVTLGRVGEEFSDHWGIVADLII